MAHKLTNLLFNNITIKTVSLIIGCCFWGILSQSHSKTIWVDIPICFYNQSDTDYIKAPETITVALQGKRTDLQCLDVTQLSAHVNAQELHTGLNGLYPNNTTLFLPETIKLVHYSPAHIVIEVQKNIT